MRFSQFRLRSLLACIAFLALILWLGCRIFGPAMPSYLLRQIKLGMTKAEVESILGAPNYEINNDWMYRQIGNPGLIEVWFDDDGRVVEVNDESIFIRASLEPL